MARFITLMAIVFSPLASGSSPTDLLINLLKDIDFLSAKYEQMDEATLQAGQIWLSKPYRFRLSAFTPVSQTIVSDGENLWTHDLDLEQVIITPLLHEAKNIPLLVFAGNPEKLKKNYDIVLFEDGRLQQFVLSPLEKTGAIRSIELSFSNNLPLRLVFQTAIQRRTVINFNDVSTDPVDDAMFNFEIPDDIDVIDDRPKTY